jgi:pyridinium-3,5-bisthiocarboxylic acid mononucleotide nickel chelatase
VSRIAYIDCFSGASGDMFLGALLDLGLPLDGLRTALGSLAIEYGSVSAERVLRAGVSATKFRLHEAALAGVGGGGSRHSHGESRHGHHHHHKDDEPGRSHGTDSHDHGHSRTRDDLAQTSGPHHRAKGRTGPFTCFAVSASQKRRSMT